MLKRLTALLTVFSVLLCLFACTPNRSEVTQLPDQSTISEPADSPLKLYVQACAPVRSAQALTLRVSVQQTMSVGGEQQTMQSEQEIQFSGRGTDNMIVVSDERLTIGDTTEEFNDYFTGDVLYCAVSAENASNYFCGNISREDYLSILTPAVTVDAELYNQITLSESADGYVLEFSEPIGAESWVVPDGAEMLAASGKAIIDEDGNLKETAYYINYQYGSTTIDYAVTVKPVIHDELTIEEPEYISDCTEITDIIALKVYEQGFMSLMASNSVSAGAYYTLVCQAAGFLQMEQTNLDYHGIGEDHMSKVERDFSATYSDGSDSYSVSESYQNGMYTFSDSEGSEESYEADPEDILYYCKDILSTNYVALSYISDITIEYISGVLYLELSFTDEFNTVLIHDASSTMFGDETYLDSFTTEYSVTTCNGYIAFDAATGFPTASGYAYTGTQLIEGEQYALIMQADQTYQAASLSAYETITGEAPDPIEPEEKATPLFYHVTGPEGQEMWLIGTIHVGDDRTAFLPQEIYDALLSSDALAVEFDMDAYDARLEADPELLDRVVSLYFYPDGSMLRDHMDPEAFEYALKLLKASGNYNLNAEYMRPVLWYQSIDNFYLQQGYHLVSSKGVDNRLLSIARENDIEIIDIESGEEQMAMLFGFSEELQQFLLEGTLYSSIIESCESTEELYEAWCTGDETILREMLSSEMDLSEMPDEDLEEYEAVKPLLDEYDYSMSFERNEKMLDAAISYLESGDVIFYAVGLAHLLDSNNGLVDALRDAGYTVELVAFE